MNSRYSIFCSIFCSCYHDNSNAISSLSLEKVRAYLLYALGLFWPQPSSPRARDYVIHGCFLRSLNPSLQLTIVKQIASFKSGLISEVIFSLPLSLKNVPNNYLQLFNLNLAKVENLRIVIWQKICVCKKPSEIK